MTKIQGVDKSLNATHKNQRFVIFTLGSEAFALPLVKIREVIALTGITSIPNIPLHFKGFMNLKGKIISVIDLRLKFGIKGVSATGETAIIIVDLEHLCMGVIVDSVESVLSIAANNMSLPPQIESAINTDYITGVARLDKRLLLILNIEKALSVEYLLAIKSSESTQKATRN
ncbi:MAG: purine-binding chemotaxis protein CheW [Chitinophagaceae bacterium]|nr:purine-binding chemotaxis protein CheW [Oligoflexus sp.]